MHVAGDGAKSSEINSESFSPWTLLPAIGAPLAHGPVLRWDLVRWLKRPISRRLFGQNKTWRGAVVMTGGTVAAALLLHRIPSYRSRLPDHASEANPATLGFLLGLALWTGELPNSFVKRRLGIPPGERLRTPAGVLISVFDQADWVPMAWVLLTPVCPMSPRDAARMFAIVGALHVPINLVGYAVGARTHPI
jgi:hypothetical protein